MQGYASPLYLQEGNYFSEDEFVVVGGVFDGDGHLLQYTWFPLLGNNKKKLNYSENILMLAVQAAVRLHNFIMNTEQLSNAAYESPEMHFSEYY
jgi:hypothetical protein